MLCTHAMINTYDRKRVGCLELADFEGGPDGIWAELAEMRLEYVCVLEEHGSPGLHEGVQSVEEDESDCHHQRVTKGVIINSGRRHPD